ncbi:hypothetical protein [Rheinheimera sp. EpRS3]|uniref:hypothetical protein n=1 Tax=Rheinheimera sp. EpRS3 TaxID=1712383 RepID=UPI000A6B497A|nr:hypothetical protein [Rheinheimera sp. EpRS3]
MQHSDIERQMRLTRQSAGALEAAMLERIAIKPLPKPYWRASAYCKVPAKY